MKYIVSLLLIGVISTITIGEQTEEPVSVEELHRQINLQKIELSKLRKSIKEKDALIAAQAADPTGQAAFLAAMDEQRLAEYEHMEDVKIRHYKMWMEKSQCLTEMLRAQRWILRLTYKYKLDLAPEDKYQPLMNKEFYEKLEQQCIEWEKQHSSSK